MNKTAQYNYFLNIVIAEIPTAEEEEIKTLCHLAKSIKRYALIDCSDRELTETENKNWDKKINQAKAILEKWGVGSIILEDVRGAAIKIILPSGKSNSWGGKGWIVPEI